MNTLKPLVQKLELILNELDLTMAFCGYRDINDVDGRTLWQNVEKGSKS